MKRIGNIYKIICNKDNLKQAIASASRGKRKRNTVCRVLKNENKHIEILERVLKEQLYHSYGYNKKVIQDKGSGKTREIYIPKFFPDQVVQWALILVIKPIMMRGMYSFNCASVDNRGASYGIKHLKKWLERDKKQTKYCLQTDISKYYPSISQELLLKKFEKVIKCKKTLWLIKQIVTSTSSGLPIGNVTSQWFANFYLQKFDHYVKEQLKIKYYVRYMDDMIFLSGNKRKLEKQQKQIEEYLKKEKLTLKPNWKLFKVGEKKEEEPIDFLGYRFYGTYNTMRKRTFLRLKRRIKKIYKKGYRTIVDCQATMSYLARIKQTSGKKLYKLYVKPYINIRQCRNQISKYDKAKAKKQKL